MLDVFHRQLLDYLAAALIEGAALISSSWSLPLAARGPFSSLFIHQDAEQEAPTM